MDFSRNEAFSAHRLGGEPVPEDVQKLLAPCGRIGGADRGRVELGRRRLGPLARHKLPQRRRPGKSRHHGQRPGDRRSLRVDRIRRRRQGRRILRILAWAGEKRAVADSPIVKLDNEGQFSLCAGTTLAEALLGQTYGEEQFTYLRDWFRSIGIATAAESPEDIEYRKDESSPEAIHKDLYHRYRKEAGLP